MKSGFYIPRELVWVSGTGSQDTIEKRGDIIITSHQCIAAALGYLCLLSIIYSLLFLKR
jgi:hypothetical protein